VLTIFGRVELSKAHVLQHDAFKITMYLQSLICLLAQDVVFDGASLLLKRLLLIDLSSKQIQRVSQWYGCQIDPIINANHTEYMAELSPVKDKDEHTYVMVDGSMLFTREEKWKENKLARIFHESQNIDIQSNRNEIVDTVYVSHLGGVDKFLPKVERHLSCIKSKKVFVADGAKWIWNWVEDNYPGSTQILDYFHAVEKIEELARNQFKDDNTKKEWLTQQKELLLKDGVYEVINNLKSIRSRNEMALKAKQAAIRYYEEHEDRMLYKTYKDRGLLIGSGPIEAGNRNVIQQRLKLSGQRWTIKGAQAIANLRCYQKSGAWDKIDNLIRIAA
jgi:hypothetical protein